MSDVLARICADKRQHIERRKTAVPLARLAAEAAAASAPRGFAKRLETVAGSGGYALICEIKKASPSGGVLRPDFDAPGLARAYERGGAACLSVLTDTPFFQGRDEHLVAARKATTLPVLRKDFLLDPYQVVESRALGADCVLLILAALEDGAARDLEQAAFAHGMDVLIEVHDAEELARALRLSSRLIGINNRNLKTLATDLRTTEELAKAVPADRLLVSESGIKAKADLARLAAAGARAFLVGESLMRERDVEAATRALVAAPVGAGA